MQCYSDAYEELKVFGNYWKSSKRNVTPAVALTSTSLEGCWCYSRRFLDPNFVLLSLHTEGQCSIFHNICTCHYKSEIWSSTWNFLTLQRFASKNLYFPLSFFFYFTLLMDFTIYCYLIIIQNFILFLCFKVSLIEFMTFKIMGLK